MKSNEALLSGPTRRIWGVADNNKQLAGELGHSFNTSLLLLFPIEDNRLRHVRSSAT